MSAAKRKLAFFAIAMFSTPIYSQDELIINREIGPGQLHRIIIDGTDTARHVSFRVIISRVERHNATANVTVNNRTMEQVILLDRIYPNLDLSTVKTYAGMIGGKPSLIIEIKYGLARQGCFSNTDGRNTVEISYVIDQRPQIETLDLSSCQDAGNGQRPSIP